MSGSQLISSAANPLLKDVRRALDRGSLTSAGYCVAETFHLLEEALRSEREIHAVLATEATASAVETRVRRRRDIRVLIVADRIFEALASTESSQGVIALVRPPVWTLDDLLGSPALLLASPVPPASTVPTSSTLPLSAALLIVLDGVQDPGNAGAILRAADAFGASGVLFGKGSVSPFNAKTVRASAGSLFRVPFLSGLDTAAIRQALAGRRLDVYAAVPAGGQARAPADVDLRRACAIVVGSEARGVSPELRAHAQALAIPTRHVESLNAAVAAGILLYEASRQRSPASAKP